MEDKGEKPSPQTISREELARLEIRRYEGPVRLVESVRDLDEALSEFRAEEVVGLDTETRPSFRKGEVHLPSLVQVATSRIVYLFPLKRPHGAEALAELLASASVTKAGVALAHDLKQLKLLFPFEERSVLDLGTVARGMGLAQTGVRNLAGLFLGFRVPKGEKTTNWARATLTPRQIRYAATDAWVCRELYLDFRRRGFL